MVSDILHNSSASVRNASSYRTHFQENLPDIFKVGRVLHDHRYFNHTHIHTHTQRERETHTYRHTRTHTHPYTHTLTRVPSLLSSPPLPQTTIAPPPPLPSSPSSLAPPESGRDVSCNRESAASQSDAEESSWGVYACMCVCMYVCVWRERACVAGERCEWEVVTVEGCSNRKDVCSSLSAYSLLIYTLQTSCVVIE